MLLSPFIKPGTVNDTPYNHYSLLRTIENLFGLEPSATRRMRAASGRRLGRRPVTRPTSVAGQVLTGAAGVAGALAVGAQTPGRASAASRLPAPGTSGIDHIVVLMMENRSFDHYLGWLPGADGRQAGLTTSTATAYAARRTT